MSLCVRILAPTGRDADLTIALLSQNGVAAEACTDIASLLRESAECPIGALLVAEEALDAPAQLALFDYLRAQPPWSDMPVLILSGVNRSNPRASGNRFEHLQSPVLLERPLRPDTLVSSIQAALRARQRQYEIRDTLRQRDDALAALRNEQETLKVIIDNLPVGILVADRTGALVLTNRRAEQILRRPLQRGAANTADEVWQAFLPDMPGAPPEERSSALRRALETSEVVPPEDFLYRHGDGSFQWVRVAAAPIVDPQGNVSGAVAALSDIDHQRRSEAALIKSEKLAAVGRLAASISHEINNPLEAVTNLLYLVEQSTRGMEASHLAARAQEELARVSQIVTQTLRFHRQSSHPQYASVKDLLEPAIGLYQGRIANHHIELDLQYRTNDRIFCRDGDIRQVLNNLIGNAIDAMRSGGRLIVRSSQARNSRTNAPGIRISIADTGHGIPQRTMQHIFEPFYTTKGESGTGLGLWISQEIVTRNKGTLRIRSRAAVPNSGTIATVFFPVEIGAT